MVVTVDSDKGVVRVDPFCQGDVAAVRNVAAATTVGSW
jgi:hypothetical protein